MRRSADGFKRDSLGPSTKRSTVSQIPRSHELLSRSKIRQHSIGKLGKPLGLQFDGSAGTPHHSWIRASIVDLAPKTSRCEVLGILILGRWQAWPESDLGLSRFSSSCAKRGGCGPRKDSGPGVEADWGIQADLLPVEEGVRPVVVRGEAGHTAEKSTLKRNAFDVFVAAVCFA